MDLVSDREEALTGLVFTWTNDERLKSFGVRDPDSEQRNNLLAQQYADRVGIKYPAERQNYLKKLTAEYDALGQPSEVTNSLSWSFESTNDAVIVSAQARDKSTFTKYQVVLGREKRMVIPDEVNLVGDDQASVQTSVDIYATHSPAWCYRDPGLNFLTVTPEQVSLFCGKNPFMMYGNKWTIQSDDSEHQVIKTI